MKEFSVPLDPRVAMMIAGFDRTGRPVPLGPGHLEARSQQWTLAGDVPRDVKEIMNVARSLYAHAVFVYEFATVAAHYALLSFEAALRHRLPRSPKGHGLGKLIDVAVAERAISASRGPVLHEYVRKARNEFSHPSGQTVWSLPMATEMLDLLHAVIGELFMPTADPVGP